MSTHPLKNKLFAWCLYDWANSGFATVILAAVLPVYIVNLIPDAGVPLPWTTQPLPATAFWGYTVSFSMMIVALAAPLLGQLADQNSWRQRMLALFCLLGACSTAALSLTNAGGYMLTALLFVIGNIGFAAGNIFYNAYLKNLAHGTEADRLSSRGYAFGYLGGGLLLLIVFLIIQKFSWFGFSDMGQATRASFLLTGTWWLLFAIPALVTLGDKNTPAPDVHIRGVFKRYRTTLAKVMQHRELRLFLIAFLLYNDGIQTIIAISAVFARDELQLSQTTILGCFLLIQFLATPGALFFGRLAEKFGAKRCVILSLMVFTGITAYASQMSTAAEFWGLGIAVACVLGGSQALSRSLFVRMVPENSSSEFFACFAISSKFASIFGPLLVAVLIHLSGSSRLAILSLASFFILGLLLLARVDVDAGARRAQQGSAP
ncbi:MAG: MFS transporter [Desulfuromonas sp.]|nr:MAG: MFS transporter [Desulfuromonas sp.]